MMKTKWLLLWRDKRGQDFAEYALIAAFLVTVWGAMNQNVATHVSHVFSRINTSLVASAANGN